MRVTYTLADALKNSNEALLRCGKKEYGIIVWITKKEDYEEFVKIFKSYLV